ncbi:flagellin [Shewanella frigidimarina]|uniref:Flagellin n=1 Tax=Shewanella frigidimarina TaxID=56812 RepID=A0A106BWM2_SHEFR|nr:flagellin [Shewanella frigidimarina]KVW99815.1 Lateral flagellin [Shewanella frigidimarina]
MLSVHTNYASLVSQGAVSKSNSLLTNAMERLSTGLRINSAADDAAGLQIANRMNANLKGMQAASRNISDATSMLQTADGALEELTTIANRQKELATQAANGVNSDADREALNAEFQALTAESARIMGQTTYAGNDLMKTLGGTAGAAAVTAVAGVTGSPAIPADPTATPPTAAVPAVTAVTAVAAKLAVTAVPGSVQFQIGANGAEILKTGFQAPTAIIGDISTAAGATAAMAEVDTYINEVGTARSTLGASINRLGHTASNLSSVMENTQAAAGRIMDADFAVESANMTRNQMLVQAGTTVLSSANQNTGLVMGLLR